MVSIQFQSSQSPFPVIYKVQDITGVKAKIGNSIGQPHYNAILGSVETDHVISETMI